MEMRDKIKFIKNIYFYLVSFVALMMMAFSAADLISTALKTYVFTKADNYNYYYPAPACDPAATDPQVKRKSPEECVLDEEKQKKNNEEARIANLQRSLVEDIGRIVVGLPLFLLHWRVIRRKEE